MKLFSSWKGVSSRSNFLLQGFVLTNVLLFILSLSGLFFIYGTDTFKVYSIAYGLFDFGTLSLNVDLLFNETLRAGIRPSPMGNLLCSVWLLMISILYVYRIILFHLKRLRDIFGSLKFRYVFIAVVLMILPIVNYLMMIFFFAVPGRISKNSKFMDPVIRIIG